MLDNACYQFRIWVFLFVFSFGSTVAVFSILSLAWCLLQSLLCSGCQRFLYWALFFMWYMMKHSGCGLIWSNALNTLPFSEVSQSVLAEVWWAGLFGRYKGTFTFQHCWLQDRSYTFGICRGVSGQLKLRKRGRNSWRKNLP